MSERARVELERRWRWHASKRARRDNHEDVRIVLGDAVVDEF